MTEPFEVFSVRDLRNRASDLIRDAEKGRLAIITKHGRPAILAVPFDERLLSHGVHRALALHLFEAGHVTLVQAARLAGLAAELFIELLAQAGVPAVSYSSEELADELETAR
jgi:prevent-host-death family protein